VRPGVLDDKDSATRDGPGAEGIFASDVGQLEPVAGLEPDAVLVDEGDEAAGGIADGCCELGERVEAWLGRRVEYPAAGERPEAPSLGCCLGRAGVREWRGRLCGRIRRVSDGGRLKSTDLSLDPIQDGYVSAGCVLIVDDDPPIRTLVGEFLTRSGYTVEEAADGLAGLQAFYRTSPDLVILDVAMPELDGWQVLQRIREVSEIPVLMLTAKTAETDKVRGLRSGADDYLTKPFGRQELLARVDALLRRATKREAKTPNIYSDKLLTVDFRQRRAELRGRELTLTPLEFRLLAAFVRHPKQVLSHDQLLELAWGDARWVSREQLRLTVSYLRRKLGADGRNAIATFRGFGYRYTPAR